MRTFLFVLACVAGLTKAAHAEVCYTNCFGSGDYQTCVTTCY